MQDALTRLYVQKRAGNNRRPGSMVRPGSACVKKNGARARETRTNSATNQMRTACARGICCFRGNFCKAKREVPGWPCHTSPGTPRSRKESTGFGPADMKASAPGRLAGHGPVRSLSGIGGEMSGSHEPMHLLWRQSVGSQRRCRCPRGGPAGREPNRQSARNLRPATRPKTNCMGGCRRCRNRSERAG